MEHQLNELESCPSCGSTSFGFSHESIDHTVSQEVFRVVYCKECFLYMTNPRPADERLGEYYKSEDYVSHTESKKGLINSIYHRVRKRTLKEKVRLVRSLNSPKSILDYGAGTGRFLAECHGQGMSVRGAEPDADAVANIPPEIKVNVTDPDTVLIEEDRYDTVTMWHVLEHVSDLQAVIKRLKEKLNPGGRLIIAVPNHRSYDAEYYSSEWAAWDVPRHLWHFAPESMEHLMNSAGLEIIDILPMWYDSVYVSLLSEKTKRSGIFGPVRGVIVGLISNLKHWSGNKPRCSSQIYIVKATESK